MISFIHLLLMIVVANSSPIIMYKLLHDKYNYAIDAGIIFFDGQPLLGTSKTWRGIISSLLITSIIGIILGYAASTGFFISLLAMAGDLCSSFIKRRLKCPPSSKAILLDQIPESLLPAAVMMYLFGLNYFSVFLLISLFVIFEIYMSKILYLWGMRKRPY